MESFNMSPLEPVNHNQQSNDDITNKILLAIKDIRFGSLEVVIHDSKVVQIERKEKIRFATHQSQPSR